MMTEEKKLCILLFDEVSLKPQITYSERKDKVTGFVDNGQQRTPEFADHAQVFMVRGLIKNYKQPVSYTFSSSATKGPELASQTKAVVTELQKAGLTVVASVCDQGSNNRQAIKILLNGTRGIYLRRGEEPKENIILINGDEIVPLYDPPHLLKGLRNNLMTKNLKYEDKGKTKTAKWSHLQLLLKENPGYKGVRILPKLTENHVNPEKMNKMKVKYASQIFSQTVATNMGYLADKGILPKECQQTADLLLIIDQLFDSVNGSFKKNKHAKPLLGPVTPSSPHQ
ncbi:transposase protein domain-containing protein [Phthorimaea operculella]|nr:transposase protein domain-containing protein [Phthorimaea operculella]